MLQNKILSINQNVKPAENVFLIKHSSDFLNSLGRKFTSINEAMMLLFLGELFFIVALIPLGFVIFQKGIENLVNDSLLELTVGDQSERAKEWVKNGSKVVQRNQVVNFVHFFQKNIANLEGDSCCGLGRFLGIYEQGFDQSLVPLNQGWFVAALLNEKKSLVELVSEEHQVLVDSEVVNFIPMHVEDVQESLKPLLFVLVICQLVHKKGNSLTASLLVKRLIRVPNHYS